MPKKRRSRAFWKNFKFKYKLTVVNENTLEEIVGLRVSKLNGLSVLLSVLAVLFPDCGLHHCFHPFAELSSGIYEQ